MDQPDNGTVGEAGWFCKGVGVAAGAAVEAAAKRVTSGTFLKGFLKGATKQSARQSGESTCVRVVKVSRPGLEPGTLRLRGHCTRTGRFWPVQRSPEYSRIAGSQRRG